MPKRKKFEPIPISDQVEMGIPGLNGLGIGLGREKVYLDFFYNPPRSKKVYLASRIWLSPRLLKRITEDLEKAMKTYEKEFGKIKT